MGHLKLCSLVGLHFELNEVISSRPEIFYELHTVLLVNGKSLIKARLTYLTLVLLVLLRGPG
jgi:hypothetical protein